MPTHFGFHMNRMLCYLHAAAVLAAYALYMACWVILPRTVTVSARLPIVAFAAIGFLSGLVLLVVLRGISGIAVIVGVSTIAAFILLVLSV